MHTILVRNVHAALPEGLRYLSLQGIHKTSRSGDVIVAPGPVMTVYERPWENVIFWPERNANPFFHLMESIWILGGRRDVAWISKFNKRMVQYSDDGEIFHGAYGWRLRNHFGHDQLDFVCNLLKNDQKTRRAVLTMWDPATDLISYEDGSHKDLPCNTQIYLSIRAFCLVMTVLCRSNDIIWGAYGTNAVHFSVLQAYLASRIGVGIGKLYQFSNDYHAYSNVFNQNAALIDEAADPYRTIKTCPYTCNQVFPLNIQIKDLVEVDLFLDEVIPDGAFWQVMIQIRAAWEFRNDPEIAIRMLDAIPDDKQGRELDWKRACREWLQRRADKKIKGEDANGRPQ